MSTEAMSNRAMVRAALHVVIVTVAAACTCSLLLAAQGCKKQQAGSKLAEGKTEVSLVFAGDLSVARDVAKAIEKNGGGDPAYPFSKVRPLIAEADLFFANLVCVLADSDDGEVQSKTFRIRAPTANA